ncbi:rod shape-determining protein MreD [Thermoactinospora rubra]|uniref:rod shape-determining protein MreD n=1 Tax=Thermoactinospora rubra TaxID=1088767 RepID=UPI000A118CC6|nr:rod shape-determining protein MreD [Thermoactinospora rubra]
MIAALTVVAAILLQVTVVNRVPLPGGGGPDLVLLAVVGLALTRGPVTGAVIGFCAGLLTDLAPPTAHVAGQYAFVFAAVGFLAGRGVRGMVPTVVVCVLVAPLLAAAIGGLIGDPRVTPDVLVRSLPASAVYTLLLAPPTVWLVTRVHRRYRA